MNITKVGGRWVYYSRDSQERHKLLAAGFRCSPDPGPHGERVWYTTDGAIASRLMDPAAAAAAAHEQDLKFKLKQALVATSSAAEADLDVPTNPGCVYLPYQVAGIAGMFHRAKVLLADDPGLGKTIQVAGLINLDESLRKILIIAPRSLTLNWQLELRKWLVRDYTTAICSAKFFRPDYCDISIIHYEVLWRHLDMLRSVRWDLVVADECHLLKNPSALRSRAILGIDKRTANAETKKAKEAWLEACRLARRENKREPDEPEALEPLPPVHGRRDCFLTGTPLPNRPVEGLPIFHHLDPVEFKKGEYKREFCGGGDNGYGYDDSGASNLNALQIKLRSTIMIRRLKRDVMKDLPAKRRSIIELPHGHQSIVKAELDEYLKVELDIEAARQAAAQAKASERDDEYKAAVGRLKAAKVAAFAKISKQRHDTALATLPFMLDHIQTIIDGGEKLVVFAHHQDIIEAILAKFGRKFTAIYGKIVSTQERQRNKDRFQTDPTCLGIVGNYGPMGVGWTLTAASRMLAVELDWVPGNMKQAEDRLHRIGQKQSVLIEHLVLQGSLAAYMARRVVEKQEIQDQALDTDPADIPDISLAALAQVAPVRPAASRPAQNTSPAPAGPRAPEVHSLRELPPYQQMAFELALEPDAW